MMDEEERTKINKDINVFLFEPSMKIINEVKKRPALYDLNVPLEARCKKARKRLWTEVSEILNAPIEDVIRRWRALRDRYTKYRRQYMSYLQDVQCDSDVKLPQFQYYRHLKFLEPIIEKQKLFLPPDSFKTTMPTSIKRITPKRESRIKRKTLNNTLKIDNDFKSKLRRSSLVSSKISQVVTESSSNIPHIKYEIDPLDINFDNTNYNIANDPLNDNLQSYDDYDNFGRMIAIRLEKLQSKRIAKHCETEIINMLANAEMHDSSNNT